VVPRNAITVSGEAEVAAGGLWVARRGGERHSETCGFRDVCAHLNKKEKNVVSGTS